jgi:hypothetical protein
VPTLRSASDVSLTVGCAGAVAHTERAPWPLFLRSIRPTPGPQISARARESALIRVRCTFNAGRSRHPPYRASTSECRCARPFGKQPEPDLVALRRGVRLPRCCRLEPRRDAILDLAESIACGQSSCGYRNPAALELRPRRGRSTARSLITAEFAKTRGVRDAGVPQLRDARQGPPVTERGQQRAARPKPGGGTRRDRVRGTGVAGRARVAPVAGGENAGELASARRRKWRPVARPDVWCLGASRTIGQCRGSSEASSRARRRYGSSGGPPIPR